eukprot:14011-Heterococcus_DN1.PRE.1
MDPRKDLQQLEALLDGKKGASPRRPSIDGTAALKGWSPHREASAPQLDETMSSLSLGASVHDAQSGSELQGEPRKAKEAGKPPLSDAGAGFAKKPKLSKTERRELQEKQRAAKFGSDVSAPPSKSAAAGADAGRAGTAGGSASSHH